MIKAEKRPQIIGEIHEALIALWVKKYFEVLFLKDDLVSVIFPDEGDIRFGVWNSKTKKFSHIHEKYRDVYTRNLESHKRYLEPIEKEPYIDKVKEANELLGELIPKLVSLGLTLCELEKGEECKG